ncbi:hypothetical protein SAY87_010446 [Trapa incisa]|uniref:Protein kinase domain-containing protein n=1 Tax=Trapa incisa TaxID=236973 RepID=A0AAN7GU55_9MYRT|nr:hypothetical protein SAY87_010446 [Trapa incisa]
MGCVSSKQAVSVTPAIDHSGLFRDNVESTGGSGNRSGRSRVGWAEQEKKKKKKKKKEKAELNVTSDQGSEAAAGESGLSSYKDGESVSFRLGNLHRYMESEQVAAGWPAWLSAVAGEAIQGWVPLKADTFEKLEKIGQGTYSSVFRARDLDTGRIVALKKVRFDNFEPESVRFMAREILILRRLDHPNVMKLEGLITSRLSCSIYLVFDYMEHDITGLLSCPNIKFSEAQIKCYAQQLLSGIEHCHSRGVMHRDIKGSNLLVNNEGILKIADFGLANFSVSAQKQPLTSRVVTLWYRPPELLLGSTDYGASIDLWSVGCVFAEIIKGKPILQGRTEVEQLHKIFKLCGSPPDDYWKRSRLPHATLFKPQHPYYSSLRETFRDLPPSTIDLIETLLSVEPQKRGTASHALSSEYFRSKPYACDPSSLPIYPPSKEMDAKYREDAKRKKGSSGRYHGPDTARKPSRKPPGTNKLVPSEELPSLEKGAHKVHSNGAVHIHQEGKDSGAEAQKSSLDEASHAKNASQGDIPFSGPLEVPSSSGFTWAKRRKDDSADQAHHNRSSSRSHTINISDNSAVTEAGSKIDSKRQSNGDLMHGGGGHYRGGYDSYEIMKHALTQKQWGAFDQTLSLKLYGREEMPPKIRSDLGYHSNAEKVEFSGPLLSQGYHSNAQKVEFSGPLLSQSYRVDELLERHERHIRQAVRKSWFKRAKKQRK